MPSIPGPGLPPIRSVVWGLAAVLPGYARSIAWVLLIDAAAAGFGRRLVLWIRPWRGNREYLVEFAAGLLAVSPLAILGLGLNGLLLRGVLGAVFAVSAAGWLAGVRWGKIRPGIRAEVLVAAVLLAPSFILALAPEVEYDALRYHLALPAQFLARHRIYLADPWPFPNFPLGGEMLYSAGLALGGGHAVTGGMAAKLLNWQLLPLTLALVARTAMALGMAPVCRWTAWVLVASSFMFSLLVGSAFTDLAAVAAFAAALSTAVRSGSGRAWLLFGVFLGAAGGAKLSAIALAPALFIALARGGSRIPALAGWVVMLLPWGIKNLLMAGSPFGGLFLGGFWPAIHQSEETLNMAAAARWVPFGDPSQWLWFPRYMLHEAVGAGHELSPLVVILLPVLALTVAGKDSRLRGYRAAALLSLAIWAVFGGGQVRYLAPAVPVILLACLGALSPVLAARRRAALAFGAVLGLAGLLGLARTSVTLSRRVGPLNVALGVEEPREYLARILTPQYLYLAGGTWLSDHPEAGRPYLVGDIKAYYWPRTPLFDSEYFTPYLVRWTRESRDERRLAVAFRQHGIGCLVHRLDGALTFQQIVGGYGWDPRSLGVLQRFVGMHLVPVCRMDRDNLNAHYRFYLLSPDRVKHPAVVADPWFELPYTEMLVQEANRAANDGRRGDARRELDRLLARYPGYAVARLRLAALAASGGDPAAASLHRAAAARLMGGQ